MALYSLEAGASNMFGTFFSVLLFVSSAFIAPQDSPVVVPLSVGDAKTSITRFEQIYFGKKTKFHLGLTNDLGNAQRYDMSVDKNGHFLLSWDAPITKAFVEYSFVDNQLIKSGYIGEDRTLPKSSQIVRGFLEFAEHPSCKPYMAHCMFGVAGREGRTYSQLLDLPDVKLTIVEEQWNEITCDKLKATLPKHGTIEFWFDRSVPGQLVKVRQVKKKGDYSYGINGVRNIIGEKPPGQEPSVFDNVAVWEETREITYDSNNIPKAMTVAESEFDAVGKMIPSYPPYPIVRDITIDEVQDLGNQVFTKLELRTHPVADGTEVQVDGHRGEAYEFRNGKIVRVVDEATIGSIDGVRFRKPTSQLGYYATITALFFGVLGILYYLRFVRGS